jgi:tetratricopeptide (TPR) repeat protein
MMKQRFMITGLLIVLSATVVLTATGCNSVDASNKGKKISPPTKNGDSKEDEKKKEGYVVENEVLKYAVKSYQESIVTLRWAIGGIITLISILAAAVGYVVVRHKGEYKEAVSEAKEASKEASRYAEKAEERLAGIDKKVEAKLKEIEDKGQVQIDKLIKVADKRREESRKEAERQRRISELWNEGLKAVKDEDHESAANKFKQIVEDFKVEDAAAYDNWGVALGNLARRKKENEARQLLVGAIAKFKKAVAIEPDKYEAYDNWGTALSDLAKRKEWDEAEKLLAESVTKHEKAIAINTDYYDAYGNCGGTLIYLAVHKKDDERKALLEKAKERCLKAESIKRGSGAYNLACANCLFGDEEECKRWLKVGEEEKTLPTRELAMKDEDLESVRNKEWFKGIRWKDE